MQLPTIIPSFILALFGFFSFFFSTLVAAKNADAIMGTWVGFDNNTYNGQLRSVTVEFELDPNLEAPSQSSDPDSWFSSDHDMVHVTGRMSTSHIVGRPYNLKLENHKFNIKAGYIPSLNVLVMQPYSDGRFGAREQQLAVLSKDANDLAFIKTPRSSGWPLPWILSRPQHTDEKLRELAALKQAGPSGGGSVNSLTVMFQNLKHSMTQQQIIDQQKVIDDLTDRLAQAVLQLDIEGLKAINTEADEELKAMSQRVMVSGKRMAARPRHQACPESVLGWFKAIESKRESNRFGSYLEVFQAFRPEIFTLYFGKDFLAMTQAERTSLFFEMDRHCTRNPQIPRSNFYRSFKQAFWGGLASGTNAAGPFTIATGMKALDVFDEWKSETVAATQATDSQDQSELLAKVLHSFSTSFWEAKATDIKQTADQLIASFAEKKKESALATALIPPSVRPSPDVIADRQQKRLERLAAEKNRSTHPPETHSPVAARQTDEQRDTKEAKKNVQNKPKSVSDQEAWSRYKKLKLDTDAKLINLSDALCLMGGCEERCREKPEVCPGGEEASKTRGAWEKCSTSDWSHKNCQLIISRYGKHSQTTPITIPQAYKSLYALLLEGKAFPATESNLAFVSGLGGYLTDVCQILGPKDTQVVDSFAQAGKLHATMGNNYMNPGKNLGTATSAALTMKAGIQLGQNIACRSPDSFFLAKGIVASIKASDGMTEGGTSRFVSSCSRKYSEAQCQCLAELGRATMSDIHSRSYDRAIIQEIIERNPMLGLGIGFKCKIYNY